MGEEHRRALVRLINEDESFRSAMVAATSVEDALRIAHENGIAVSADDLAPPEGLELNDAELGSASGGAINQIWPTAPWVAC